MTPEPPDPVADVRLVVATDAPGARVPADFLGLGFEMPVLADPALRGDPVLERLLANLGPGTFRFGGNSLEQTEWRPAGRAPGAAHFQLTPADLDVAFAFARRIGWRMTVALDLSRFDPVAAADEAAYLVGTGGDALHGIEIGNEPNLYPLRGLRPATWTVDSFVVEFETYASAILARSPGAPLAGPATWCTGGGEWFAAFLDRVRTPLAFTSHHFYPMGATAPEASVEHASTANLLSPGLMARTRACVDSAAAPATARGLALRVNETNSAYGFGAPGVSDVFASALWVLDHLFTLAALGVAGVNVQTGTDVNGGLGCAGVYLPICGGNGRWTARPLYYGLLAFRQAAIGRIVPVDADAPELNLAAHAALDDDGSVRLVVVNKEATGAAEVRIEGVGTGVGMSAGVLRLQAPSLLARDGVAFGSAAVAGDGTWSPAPPEPLGGSEGVWRVRVPAASAALVTIRPGASFLP